MNERPVDSAGGAFVKPVRCHVCNVAIVSGAGRYLHGDWVLCVTCHGVNPFDNKDDKP